jgi:hypothetical protein
MLTAKELSAMADAYWAIKTERLKADKVAAEFKTRENQLCATLIQEMREQEITGIGGITVRLAMDAPTLEPAVKDWSALYAYIVANNAFELLERRPGRAACKERWANGVDIPGVESYPVYKLTKQGVK